MTKLISIPKPIDERETVSDMLKVLSESEDSEEATGAMVIFICETPDTYRTWHYQARMNNPQLLALLTDQIREIQDEMREGAY